jgi:hypothetical protein
MIQTIFIQPFRSSKNHVLIFRNPRKIPLDNLRRRVIVLDIISEKSSKRRHGSDKQRSLLNVTEKREKMREISPL